MKFRKSRISGIFAFLSVIIGFGYSLLAQDLTSNLTMKDIMGNPPIEGVRPFNARFSPDGNYITFNWNNIDDDRRNHLWINSSIGAEANILIKNFRSSYFWSEDSKSIFFVRGRDLQKMEVSSKEIVKVSDTISISQVFTAAPDRKKIVCSKRDGIWMYDLDKNAEKHLSLQNGGRLTWSPDSRYICYVYENELKYLDTETGYNWTITS
ncbi:MAG: hypothetical protein GY863_01935, partial [bacterium]|nr:hypothetical protein [bacterium]